MAQLISNALMQPKPTDAVERPMTLVEKLRNKRNEWASNPHYWMDSNLIGDVFSDVIRTVKAHSEWVRCDERMPEDEQEVLWWNEAYQCLVIGEWRENRELVFYRNGDYADVSEFFYWQCLPKPPSEVQDD